MKTFRNKFDKYFAQENFILNKSNKKVSIENMEVTVTRENPTCIICGEVTQSQKTSFTNYDRLRSVEIIQECFVVFHRSV